MAKLSKKQRKLVVDFEEIKLRLPTPWEVRLRFGRTSSGDTAAEMNEKKDYLEIVIDEKITDYGYMGEMLVHEYAHCLDYAPQKMRLTRESHDDIYGILWVRVYREYYQVR